jgi:hypothetical protein
MCISTRLVKNLLKNAKGYLKDSKGTCKVSNLGERRIDSTQLRWMRGILRVDATKRFNVRRS